MISIVNQPQLYTPANAPVIFQLKSDSTNILYFNVQVINAADASVIANQKYYVIGNQVSTFDLSSILANVVDYHLINSSNIIDPVTGLVFGYQLVITENYVSNGTVTNGATLTTGTYHIWNANLSMTEYTSYDYHNYVINAATTGTRFLTDKPSTGNAYSEGIEHLYFLNDNISAKVQFNFYGTGNQLLGTQSLNVPTGNTAYRLDVTPAVLNTYYGNAIGNLYGKQFQTMFASPFGSLITLNQANYYTVQIVDSNGNAKSELRTYVLRSGTCNQRFFQMLFSNQKGGFDSITLFNPQESIQVDRTTAKNHAFAVNTLGNYSNLNAGVYNESNPTVQNTTTSTYKAFSDVLSDVASKWIRNIIQADKAYIRLANGIYLPVNITTNSYSVQLKKYSTNNNRVEISFTSEVTGLFD